LLFFLQLVDTSRFVYWGLSLAGLPGIIFMQVYGCKRTVAIGVFALFFNLFMLVCAGGVMDSTGTQQKK
jgi:hypothetical protein